MRRKISKDWMRIDTRLIIKRKIVMHDHNKVNYNEEYHFANVECCVHLLGDLKKVVDHLGHEWAKDLIELLLRENHNRNVGNYIGMLIILPCSMIR